MCCELCRQYVGVVQQFVAFQRESVEDYIVALREHLNRRTSAQAQANITLSANNGGSWDTPFFLFDYGMGELEMHDASPSGALAIVIVHMMCSAQIQRHSRMYGVAVPSFSTVQESTDCSPACKCQGYTTYM